MTTPKTHLPVRPWPIHGVRQGGPLWRQDPICRFAPIHRNSTQQTWHLPLAQSIAVSVGATSNASRQLIMYVSTRDPFFGSNPVPLKYCFVHVRKDRIAIRRTQYQRRKETNIRVLKCDRPDVHFIRYQLYRIADNWWVRKTTVLKYAASAQFSHTPSRRAGMREAVPPSLRSHSRLTKRGEVHPAIFRQKLRRGSDVFLCAPT